MMIRGFHNVIVVVMVIAVNIAMSCLTVADSVVLIGCRVVAVAEVVKYSRRR